MRPCASRRGTPDWELRDDVRRIERASRFRNFREALAFVQQAGELAESEGHHPDISFGWGHATVSLSTKKIKGLHENDFIMASKIDRMIDRPFQNSDRNSALTLRDADGFVAIGGVSTFPSFSR